MSIADLKVEIRNGTPLPDGRIDGAGVIMVTPPIGEDFWLMRVKLSDSQAIVAFPKFMTIGCGFAQETDWNTNLPLMCSTEEIFNHIRENKGDEAISDQDCRLAIDILRQTALLLNLFTQEDCDRMAKSR